MTNAEGNEINNPAYNANKSGKKEVQIAVPLKYLSNFWRNLDMPLINCEVPLILTWSREKNKYTRKYFSNKSNISNNRHKTVYSSCYFINWK